MSVINKVLRDLDRRRAADGDPHDPQVDPVLAQRVAVRSGTVSLPERAATRSGLPSWLVLLIGALLGLVFLWALGQVSGWGAHLAAPSPAVVAASAPASVSASASIPAAPSSAASVPAVAASAASHPASGVVPGMAVAASAAIAASHPVAPASTAAVPSSNPSTPSPQAVASSIAAAPIAATPAAAAATVAAVYADPVTNPQRLQQAWRDALTQAQALWNGGSHDGAIDLLQQALDMAEHAVGTARVPVSPMVPSLVRELARMQMAEGRAPQAYAMLVRLEPQLGQDADIWALRANAAQRLGSHQECIDAYAKALRLRPREARWLLGSAVSMAAMGDTANAAQMAERARAVGPVPKDIWTYLQQAGVKLQDM